MSKRWRRTAALAILLGASGALVESCNLLVGDYSIRDGPAPAIEDDARSPGPNPMADRQEPGKSANGTPVDSADAGQL
jgi:hypothetical protein